MTIACRLLGHNPREGGVCSTCGQTVESRTHPNALYPIAIALLLFFAVFANAARAHVPGASIYLKEAFQQMPPACENPRFGQEPMRDPFIGFAYGDECRIALPANRTPTFGHVHQWPEWLVCSVLWHEAGHLHGLGHSPDANDLMYEFAWRPYERCVDRRARPSASWSRFWGARL